MGHQKYINKVYFIIVYLVLIVYLSAPTEIISRKLAKKYKTVFNFEAKYGITSNIELARHREKQDITI